MLLNVLDDSDSGKIRKSIIITSSLLLIVFAYKIKITIPEALFSGDENLVTISNGTIITGLMIIQIYLLAKLWLSWSSELAIFEKNWILDAYEGERDLSKAKDQVDKFLTYCQSNNINGYFISEADASSISKLSSECERLGEVLKSEIIRECKFEIVTENSLNILLNKFRSLSTLKEYRDLRETLPDIREDIEQAIHEIDKNKKEVEELIHEYEDKKKSVKTLINNLYDIQNHFHDVSQNAGRQMVALREKIFQVDEFIAAFPDSDFYGAINLSKSHLSKGKKHKKIEIYIFNLAIPSAMGLTSLGFGIFYIFN